MALPVTIAPSQNIASLFVCVIIIVTVAITCMIIADQRRFTLFFMVGFEMVLLPQAAYHVGTIGPIPLVTVLSFIPAILLLTNSVRRQVHMSVRTQLENQMLADRLAEALQIAEYGARHDSLTGLLNRRAFEEAALVLAEQSQTDRTMFLILTDLDHFKSINDKYGHAAGDRVLKSAAELMLDTVAAAGCSYCLVARWGGEEFLLLLSNETRDSVTDIAEDLRARLSVHRPAGWPQGIEISGSFGVAPWLRSGDLHRAISQADAAMYRSKMAGRNRISYWDDAVELRSVS